LSNGIGGQRPWIEIGERVGGKKRSKERKKEEEESRRNRTCHDLWCDRGGNHCLNRQQQGLFQWKG